MVDQSGALGHEAMRTKFQKLYTGSKMASERTLKNAIGVGGKV